MLRNLLVIGIGGFIGANARYLLGSWVSHLSGAHFPVGTLVVNVVGCFGLGLFVTTITERVDVSDTTRLMIATGFFGAFTTFSTFSQEIFGLLAGGRWLAGSANIAASLLIGLLATVLGVALARAL
jgi:CrcB protein